MTQRFGQPFKPICLLLLGTILPSALAVRAETDAPSASPAFTKDSPALDRRGELIARSRLQVLEILEDRNACTEWFQQSNADAAAAFRSLRFSVDPNGPSRVSAIRTDRGALLLKHPWAARVIPIEGSNFSIWINGDGPFFLGESRTDDSGFQLTHLPWRRLSVGSFSGDTDQARITILLHELGHVIGRLPDDDNSWNGQSTRNTAEVLRHCKREVEASARKNLHSAR